MNIAFCDGGLCNRLNVLIIALALKARYGHEWQINWHQNNWCGAPLDRLFDIDVPVVGESINYYSERASQYTLLMHENQAKFPENAITWQHHVQSWDDLESLLNAHGNVFYYHNQLPAFTDIEDLRLGLSQMRINAQVLQIASDFCAKHAIDGEVIGLHIRKTDFGEAVDDKGLFDIVAQNPKRFFVCSDDAEVNERFAKLPNCVVFPKTSFPQKVVAGDWNAATRDAEGRAFAYNITRPEDSIVEALVDLLILSRTLHVTTSNSTFLYMSRVFKTTGFF